MVREIWELHEKSASPNDLARYDQPGGIPHFPLGRPRGPSQHWKGSESERPKRFYVVLI